MDEQPTFGFKDLLTLVVGDMAKATCERKGESQAQQFARSQAAIHMIMGLLPRDVTEVMLAGHCVMLHDVMTAEIHDALCTEAVTNKRTLIALNKAFNDNLDRLERYRQRPAEGQRDAPEVPPVADVPAAPVEPAVRPVASDRPGVPEMNRAARRQASRVQMRAAAATSRAASRQAGQLPPGETRTASPQRVHHPEDTVVYQPADEAVAKCRTNPEAMTALAAGDPVRFARAMGINTPNEAFLAAAKGPGSPFDPQASGPWPMAQATGTRKA
jgi:hypothetical protein